MNRVALAIRSNIPSEMDWALQSLVRMSFEAPESLIFDMNPALAPALLEKLDSAGQFENLDTYIVSTKDGQKQTIEDDMGLVLNNEEDNADSVSTRLDKTLEAALILRNSTINPENARHLAYILKTKSALVKVLSLPDRPSLVELRQYALDITESVAIFIHPHSSEDPLFRVLVGFLASDDRGVLTSALRAIARLVINVEGNLTQAIDSRMIMRICSLLLLDDEELLSVVLDFLYQYTAFPENIELMVDIVQWREPVQQLVRLLLFQANGRIVSSQDDSVPEHSIVDKAPPPGPPDLPHDLVRDLLLFPEPERATQWMRCSFEDDPDGDVTQIALWKAYESRFDEYIKLGKKLLPAADFIKNVTNAFRRAAAMVVTLPQGQQKFIIKGIRPREQPLSLKGELYIKCLWSIDESGEEKCDAMFPSVQDLYAHILSTHIPDPNVKKSCAVSSSNIASQATEISESTQASQPASQPLHPNQGLINTSHESSQLQKPDSNSISPAASNGVSSIETTADVVSTTKSNPYGEDTKMKDATENSAIESTVNKTRVKYTCRWNNCNRFSADGGNFDRREVISHVKTHIPDSESNKPLPYSVRISQPRKQLDSLDDAVSLKRKVVLVNRPTTVDERGEAAGIPLTAVLILRNIAHSQTGKKVLMGLEESLIGVAAVNGPLRNYIVDLLDLVSDQPHGRNSRSYL
ncbi:hypothetical protein V1511DRAFT_504436 [Dipodascopsis uninucleata]